ncbi:MAG: radical SAM family heme chaperone HemW [Coriobacteriales bacterium]|nr:radical SAM family heme chaperone HemW [Coriobacteriales bacterium]
MLDPYKALYIHIPFCRQRCAYCDFTTEALPPDDARIDDYFEGLIRAIREATREGLLGSIQSVYIGGGTPSHAGLKRLTSLVYTLSLSLHLHDDTEFTLEANPESLTPALVRDLYALGVNRFSLGVQSFQDTELAALGRVHNAEAARDAIRAIQERCENVSVDLMCGIPGQTVASWQDSLATAIGLAVAHISVYPLTIEEDSSFGRRFEQGELCPPDDDLQAELMEQAAETLAATGFERYEVASYAMPGFASRHNTAYWTGLPYLGLGRGAASMRMTAEGRQRLLDGTVIERLTAVQACAEDLMLGMRMARGVSTEQIIAACALIPGIATVFSQLQEQGLATLREGRYQPTQRGWLLGNRMYGLIWDSVSQTQ